MSEEFDIKLGDRVSLKRWDKHERPSKRIGDCTVTRIVRQQSETGYMITCRNDQGKVITLDRNWLEKILV